MDQRFQGGFHHEPVLVHDVIAWLGPALGAKTAMLVDCTVGGGGHAEACLETFPELTLLGMDRDSDALEAARSRLARFEPRVHLVKADFSQLAARVKQLRHDSATAVLYDLGVSSFQFDRAERGFQFRDGSPLDMRMDVESHKTAADIVNSYAEHDLMRVISAYGEERFAHRIAKAIVRRRQTRPFADGGDLAQVVKEAIPAATRRTGPHPARRTFQALRIEVNDELRSLEQSLTAAVELLTPGGRVAVLSYHSLEDRIVKRTFREFSTGCICPRDLPVCRCESRARLRVLTKKPVKPGPAEVARNPRSDSARLRVSEKLAVQPLVGAGSGGSA